MANPKKRKDDDMAEAAEQTGNDLVEVEGRELTTSEMEALAEQHAGLGTSEQSEDRIQSFIKVLHQLSPELNQRESSYVPGAVAGDIWVSAQNLLIPGAEGFMFQQISYSYYWVEWESKVPKAGSFPVNRYKAKPRGQDEGPGAVELDNGHVCIETRYHIGLVYYKDHPPFPAVITYSSTGAAVSTNFTNRQWAKKLPSGKVAPACMYLWHMATVERSNERGRWYLLVPSREGEIKASPEQFKTGLELAQRFEAQEVKVSEERTSQDDIPF